MRRNLFSIFFVSIFLLSLVSAPVYAANGKHGNPCNPCGGMMNACNPCNPCGGKMNACNPCNPCGKGYKHNPCNPCGKGSMMHKGKGSMHNACNPCNPCGKK